MGSTMGPGPWAAACQAQMVVHEERDRVGAVVRVPRDSPRRSRGSSMCRDSRSHVSGAKGVKESSPFRSQAT